MQQPSSARHIKHIILAMVGAGFCVGLSSPLLQTLLDRLRFDDWYISALSLTEALGFLAISPFIPALLRRFAHVTLIIVGLVLMGGVLLTLPHLDKSHIIFGLRALMGIGKGLIFIVGATTVNALAASQHRGSIVGIFAASFFGAEGLSPILMDILPYKPETLVVLVVLLMAISMMPLLTNRFKVDTFKDPLNLRKSYLLLSIPIVLILAFMQSFNSSTFENIFTAYAEQMGYDHEIAVLLSVIILMGGVLLSGFYGVIIGRTSRGKVLFPTMAVIFICYGILYLEQPGIVVSWFLLFFLGSAVFGLYITAMYVLGQRFRGANLAGAMTGFVMVGTVAQILSSILLGLGLDDWGIESFPLVMLIVNAIGFVAYIWLWAYHKRRARTQNLQSSQ